MAQPEKEVILQTRSIGSVFDLSHPVPTVYSEEISVPPSTEIIPTFTVYEAATFLPLTDHLQAREQNDVSSLLPQCIGAISADEEINEKPAKASNYKHNS